MSVMRNPNPSIIGVQAAAGLRQALAENAALAGELAGLRGDLVAAQEARRRCGGARASLEELPSGCRVTVRGVCDAGKVCGRAGVHRLFVAAWPACVPRRLCAAAQAEGAHSWRLQLHSERPLEKPYEKPYEIPRRHGKSRTPSVAAGHTEAAARTSTQHELTDCLKARHAQRT